MISSFVGIFITLFGIYGGEAVIKHLSLGPRAALSLGWLMGMAFILAMYVLANVMEAA
jgi:hypothetical protein